MKQLILSVLACLGIVCSAQAASLTPAAFNVVVTLTPTCQLTTAPGAINVAYTSFAASPSTATTSFQVLCTNSLPYTMALDTGNADTLGLTIPLAIRDSGDTATVAGATQSGATAATYLIKASIAAGQQGTCAPVSPATTCVSTVPRTLTISY